MDKDFWLGKWRRNEIGFHEPQGNRLLQVLWDRVGVPADTAVLVPMCGKTVDMVWLRSRGHRVVGVELTEEAVVAFFAEQGLEPVRAPAGRFERWSAEGIDILLGDLFDLTPEAVSGAGAFYDRAALIALPGAMRGRYVDVLRRCLGGDTRGLLVTLDYRPADETAPPFSVAPAEVEALFGDWLRISPLLREDVLAATPSLSQRGLAELYESAYVLSPARMP